MSGQGQEGPRLDTSKIGLAKQAQFMRNAVQGVFEIRGLVKKLQGKVDRLEKRVKALESSTPVKPKS